MRAYEVIKFLHILTVVFMAAPLYNLIVVNERLRFGKAPTAVDRYFENLIKTNAVRCFVFQATDDYLLQAEVSRKVSDRFSISIGGNILGGGNETAFFGQFKDNDNFFVRARYDF